MKGKVFDEARLDTVGPGRDGRAHGLVGLIQNRDVNVSICWSSS